MQTMAVIEINPSLNSNKQFAGLLRASISISLGAVLFSVTERLTSHSLYVFERLCWRQLRLIYRHRR